MCTVVYVHACVQWSTYMHVYSGLRTCMCTVVYIHACVQWSTYMHVYSGLRTCMCTVVYVHACVQWSTYMHVYSGLRTCMYVGAAYCMHSFLYSPLQLLSSSLDGHLAVWDYDDGVLLRVSGTFHSKLISMYSVVEASDVQDPNFSSHIKKKRFKQLLRNTVSLSL